MRGVWLRVPAEVPPHRPRQAAALSQEHHVSVFLLCQPVYQQGLYFVFNVLSLHATLLYIGHVPYTVRIVKLRQRIG